MSENIEGCVPSDAFDLGGEPATAVAGVFKAIADPLRLRMLAAIASDPRGECCVCDLMALTDVSQPTVSHHLKVLKQAGVLLSERRGTWVYYRLAPGRDAISTVMTHVIPALMESP